MSCFYRGSVLKTFFVTFSQRFVKSARMYSICIQNAISKDLFVFCSSPTKATLDINTLYTCTMYILLLPGWGEGKGEAIFCKETLPAVLYVSVSVFNGLLHRYFLKRFQQIKASDGQRHFSCRVRYIPSNRVISSLEGKFGIVG
jgi:hypothetical protein